MYKPQDSAAKTNLDPTSGGPDCTDMYRIFTNGQLKRNMRGWKTTPKSGHAFFGLNLTFYLTYGLGTLNLIQIWMHFFKFGKNLFPKIFHTEMNLFWYINHSKKIQKKNINFSEVFYLFSGDTLLEGCEIVFKKWENNWSKNYETRNRKITFVHQHLKF